MDSKLERALAQLQSWVQSGMEFPDACGKASRQFKVDYDLLRDAYDEDDIKRNIQ